MRNTMGVDMKSNDAGNTTATKTERAGISQSLASEITSYIDDLTPENIVTDNVLPVDLISKNARKIIDLQTRGVKLKAIYGNILRQFNINISYNTFTQYLSQAATAQGLRRTVRPRYACQDCRQKAVRRAFAENKIQARADTV